MLTIPVRHHYMLNKYRVYSSITISNPFYSLISSSKVAVSHLPTRDFSFCSVVSKRHYSNPQLILSRSLSTSPSSSSSSIRTHSGHSHNHSSSPSLTRMADIHHTEIRNGRKIHLVIHDNPLSTSSTSSAIDQCITLFFVHGSMAHHGQFTPQLEYFSKNPYVKRIVAYDAYGCGKSEKPENKPEAYAETELLTDLITLFKRYANPNGKNIIIGHSFGSNLAMCLAQHIYDTTTTIDNNIPNIHGLVLIGTAADKPGNTWIFHLPEFVINMIRGPLGSSFLSRAFHRDAPSHLLEASKAHNRTNPLHVIRPFYQQVEWKATTVLARQKSTTSLSSMDSSSSSSTPNSPVVTTPTPAVTTNTMDLLPIHLPATCVIVGIDDQLTPVSASQAVADAIPNSTLHIIENASHMVMLEQPAKVNALIEGHLLRVLKESSS